MHRSCLVSWELILPDELSGNHNKSPTTQKMLIVKHITAWVPVCHKDKVDGANSDSTVSQKTSPILSY